MKPHAVASKSSEAPVISQHDQKPRVALASQGHSTVESSKAKPQKRRAAVEDTKQGKHAKLDPHGVTYEQVDVFKDVYHKLATLSWPSLLLIRTEITEKSKLVEGVHPLGFLLLVHTDATLKKHLTILKGSWVITQPWEKTHEGFTKEMRKHKEKGTLYLDAFLEKVEGLHHDPIRERVEKNEFKQLLEMFL